MSDLDFDRRVRALFEEAVELEPEARKALLDRECGDDGSLRSEIERLLRWDERTEGFLAEPAVLSPRALVGRKLGPFRLMEKVGSGGTSIVFRAEREDGDLRQEVAVKLLRIGMDSAEMQRRFTTERQILADLRHPFVARLLDGGTTADGTPFVVMEYVRGLPITRYCDERGLTVRERLELFLDVCDAVQSAHRQLVAHLDLKPANILVDESGRPKLLDFGIAKLLASAEDEGRTTAISDRLVTPAYASPEQLSGRRVSTSSDVYSLGALLCELLTGSLPFDRTRRLPSEAAGELEAESPRTPSQLAASASSDVARERGLTPGSLSRRLEGDLDTIVLKAVEWDPERRYESVEAVRADLRRHLEGLPVRARPPRLGYRLRKYARRNLAPLLAAAALAAGLIAVAIVSLVYSADLARERDRAQTERLKAERVVELLIDSIEAADPYGGGSPDVTALQIVDAAAQRVDRLAGQPEEQAALQVAIGRLYHRIGLLDEALEHLTAALAGQTQLVERGDESLAATHSDLAALYTDRSELDLAEDHARTALDLWRQLHGEVDARVADSMWQLAQVYHEQAKYDRAKQLGERTLALRRQLFGEESEAVAASLTSLARVVYFPDNYEQAARLAREAVATTQSVFGPKHPNTGEAHQALLHVLMHQGRFQEGAEQADLVLEIFRESLPEPHFLIAAAINDLAVARYQLGDYETAATRFREALEPRIDEPYRDR